MLALIDADIVTFVEAAVAQPQDYFGDGLYDSEAVDVQAAVSRAAAEVERCKESVGADAVVLVFSDRERRNFRKRLLGIPYKESREGSSKPAGYYEIEDGLKALYPWYEMAWLEGDDVLGILHTDPALALKHDGTCVVSGDKDMKTVPGLLFNPRTDEEPRLVSRNEAIHFWMYQTLMGDRVDGYYGCPGVGEKKAAAALPDWRDDKDPFDYYVECLLAVNELYASRVDIRPDLALLDQARAAHILQYEDYDPATDSIRLWHPTDPTWVKLSSL